MDSKTKFEQLKSALFAAGMEAIDDFLGYAHPAEEDKDVTDRRMDEVWDQMPWEELEKYYTKHGISVLD